ncbi:MAG: peptidylprolyl isomerase [Gemmatimonadota bacterium]
MRGAKGIGLTHLPLLLLLLLVGCDRGPGEGTAVETAGFELTVEEAAELLAPNTSLPNDSSIVETIVDFWTDYTLLAWAVNEPGELDALDISNLMEQERSRALVTRLRAEVLQPDTAISAEELQEAFDAQQPGREIQARHILLNFPEGATPAQRDSVTALAEDLHQRALAGEDFGELAREYSQDPGSGPQGGDLGFFGRGAMVPPFEEAAFALEPGETSEIVESQFGLHIIRVDDLREPTLAEVSDQFRAELQERRVMAAESIYLEEVEAPENVQVAEGAYGLVRSITETPDEDLGREGSTPLTTYESGAFTAEDYREFVRSLPAQVRGQIVAAPDPQLEQMLRDVTRDQIILSDAEARGIALEESTLDSMRVEIRNQYPEVAEFLGLASIEPEEGESMRDAVESAVDDLMTRVVANQQDVVPLGSLAVPLRDRYEVERSADAVARIIERVDALRAEDASGGTPPAPSDRPSGTSPVPPAPADGSGQPEVTPEPGGQP